MVRRMRIAAVQMRSRLGQKEHNMRHATEMIEEAASQGAELVVLPEMAIPGYALSSRLWDLAEPAGRPSERWLRKTASSLGIHVGAGLVEVDGEDFYNTYLVAGPDGTIEGRVRKTQAEFAFFKEGCLDSHFAETAKGRIGVGICADTHRTFLPRLMKDTMADLLLMPHAWPVPFAGSRFIKTKDIEEQNANARDYALTYSKMLGIPTVFVNQTGQLEGTPWDGIIGRIMDAEHFHYPGYSAIVDSDQTVKARAEEDEAVICADVTMDPTRAFTGEIPDYKGWVHPGNVIMRSFILPFEIRRGKSSYRKSSERRQKARLAQTGSCPAQRCDVR